MEMEIKNLTKEFLQEHIDEFLKVVSNESEFYWTEENLLCELPGKWEYSYYVAKEQRVIGYAICSKKIEGYVHLHHFMISESFQSKGLGKILLVNLQKNIMIKKQKGLTLRVQPENIRAIQFYLKLGFRKVKEELDGDFLMVWKQER
jgi:ribosomal protein S18 acetylase RimI-like enzyme